jgi:PKD repeat protein
MRPPANRRDFLKLSGVTALLPARVGSAEPIMDRSQQSVSAQTTATDWEQVAKLTASDGDSADWFGISVGIDGDSVVIAAWRDEDPNGEKAGSAYVFEGGGGTNQSLSAKFTYSPRNPEAGNQVTFDASESSDPDGSIAAYEWDVSDDGSIDMTGQQVTYSFTDAGTYEIRLQVSDDEDTTATTTQSVTVEEGEGGDAPVAKFTYSPETPETGDEVTFDASDSNDPNGSIRAYEWDSPDEGEFEKTGARMTTFTMPGEHVVSLRVTDGEGATDTAEKAVTTDLAGRAEKIALAEEIDNTLYSDFNDKMSAENTIDGLRKSVINDNISPEMAENAIQRLIYAEQVTKRRSEVMTSPPDNDYNNADERNLAGHTAEFALRVGVKILMTKFHIARKVSKVFETIQEIGSLLDRLQEGYEELIKFIRTGSPDLASKIEKKTDDIADDVYTEIERENLTTAEEVAQSVEAKISDQKGEIAKGFRGKEEVRKYKDDPEAPPEVYNIAGSLHYLNQRLSAQSLSDSGLQGTQSGAKEAKNKGISKIEAASDGAHDKMVGMHKKVSTVRTAETVLEPVVDSWGYQAEVFSLVIDLVTGLLQGRATGSGIGKINKITGIHAEGIIKIVEGDGSDDGGLY